MSERDELARLAKVTRTGPLFSMTSSEAEAVADRITAAGYRKIFDGDCGLSGITNPDDREAAEAWMRFSNIVLGNDHDGIAAMKQMLTEFGYRKVQR